MELKRYRKIDIARSLLENACALYKEQQYFAVLNLSGASEEILGKYLKKNSKENALESEKRDFILINKKLFNRDISDTAAADFLNKSKNAIKHYDEKNSNGDFVVFDPKDDAESMLLRALTNWWRLEEDLTPLMDETWREIEGVGG
jgi:hypothetical protein